VEYFGHVGPPFRREKIEYFLRIEEINEKDKKVMEKVELFVSKRNRLVKTYASTIPRKNPDNIGKTLRLDWSKIKCPIIHIIYV
jgi:hypothetical protein